MMMKSATWVALAVWSIYACLLFLSTWAGLIIVAREP